MKHIKWVLPSFFVLVLIAAASLTSNAECYKCQYLQNTKKCYNDWCNSGNQTGTECCGNKTEDEEEQMN